MNRSIFLCFLIAITVNVYGQKTRSSSSSSSSSRFSSPSSSSSSKPVSSSPKFSSPSSSSSKPVSSSPKFSSPSSSSSKPVSSSPKFSSPSSSSPTVNVGSQSISVKPTAKPSEKSQAARAEQSRKTYVESKKATLPPLSSYTNQEGKVVKINRESPVVKNIRDRDSSYITPESRKNRAAVIVNHYHYSRPVDWYYSQPYVNVGGGYSSAFWWMMSEWSAERRARWLYNHQDSLEREAYQRGLKDAKVAQLIADLESKKTPKDPNYIDGDFLSDPSLMYDQSYVEAAYNREYQTKKLDSEPNGALTFFAILTTIGVVVLVTYLIVFRIRWGN